MWQTRTELFSFDEFHAILIARFPILPEPAMPMTAVAAGRLTSTAESHFVAIHGPDSVGVLPWADIIALIMTLLDQCTKPKALAEANRPGVLSRFRLRRALRDVIPGDDRETTAVRDDAFNALIAAGKTVTAEDFAE